MIKNERAFLKVYIIHHHYNIGQRFKYNYNIGQRFKYNYNIGQRFKYNYKIGQRLNIIIISDKGLNIIIISDKGLKSTVVNQVCHFVYRDLLNITPKFPLKGFYQIISGVPLII